jgi:RNA polymerase sigma-70 factor, ECF subfamily
MDEIQLVRDANSSAGAFIELYRRHVTRVYCYHAAHTGNTKAAEDLTSQTFMAALTGLRSFRGSGSFAVWVMEIAVRKRRQDIRANRRELPIDAVLYYQSSALQRRELESISRLLKQISQDQAEALILFCFGGLTDSEVSRVLKKSADTTGMLIARGLEDLRTRTSLNLDEETTEHQETIDPKPEDERLAEKLTDIAHQITPDPHFISELEQTLVANHVPNANWTFSWQQLASLAGWAVLIGIGVFLLNWRVSPSATSTEPAIADAKLTSLAEVVLTEAAFTSSPTARVTATRLPTLEYTVQPGDTCTYIANRFGVTIEQLITLNDLNSSCDIFVDQILVVPILPTPTPQTD